MISKASQDFTFSKRFLKNFRMEPKMFLSNAQIRLQTMPPI